MEHRFGFKLTTCYRSLGRTADLRRLVTTLIERRVEEANTAAEALKALKLDDPGSPEGREGTPRQNERRGKTEIQP